MYLIYKAIVVINLTLAIQLCGSLGIFTKLHAVKQHVCRTQIC